MSEWAGPGTSKIFIVLKVYLHKKLTSLHALFGVLAIIFRHWALKNWMFERKNTNGSRSNFHLPKWKMAENKHHYTIKELEHFLPRVWLACGFSFEVPAKGMTVTRKLSQFLRQNIWVYMFYLLPKFAIQSITNKVLFRTKYRF